MFPPITPSEIFLDCHKQRHSSMRRGLIDVIFGRSLSEKAITHCHVELIKMMRINNFKRDGRWAFYPILGIYEFFSTLFSFTSLLSNVCSYNRLVFPRLSKSPIRRLLLIQYFLCNLAMFGSVLLHTHETTFTRNADYFAAFLSIVIGLIVVINRFVFYTFPNILRVVEVSTLFFGTLFSIFHIYTMAFVDFNYVYNKTVCAGLLFTSCLFDICLLLINRGQPYTIWIFYYISCIILGGCVELMDISPLGFLLDSHAIWHLLMTLSSPFFSKFVSGDIEMMAAVLERRSSEPELKLDNQSKKVR